MKVDIGIQIGEKKAEVYNGVEHNQALKIISKAAPEMAERVKITEERLSLIQKEIITDADLAVEYYLLAAAQSKADELLNCDLSGRNEDGQFERINQYHRYASVGSALLYRNARFGGATKFFTVTWPNFNWWPYKFNDVASSAKAWGANILFQHSWYRGRRLYLIGLPYVEFPDLSVFEFNDMASSFVSIP